MPRRHPTTEFRDDENELEPDVLAAMDQIFVAYYKILRGGDLKVAREFRTSYENGNLSIQYGETAASYLKAAFDDLEVCLAMPVPKGR